MIAYLPDYRIGTVDPCAYASITDLIFFSIEPTPTGGLDAARLTPGARYGLAKVSSAIKGFDVICADYRRGGKPYYRQCVVVRRRGPIRQRVVGGYRRPPRAFETKSDHYACWGRALTLHLCRPGWLEPGPGGGPPLPLRAFR